MGHPQHVTVAWDIPDRLIDRAAWEWFEERMRALSKSVKGAPRLVIAWDDGGGHAPWYQARRGPEELALRAECTRRFGAEPREKIFT